MAPHSTEFSGGACHRSSKASRRENLEIEQPVACRDGASFDFHPTLPGMLGATLVGHQSVQMGQPTQKRLVAPCGVMAALHRAELPLAGVRGLSQEGAGHGPLRVGEDHIPARLLLVAPAPAARAVGCPGAVGHAVGTVAEPLPQRTHPPALALAGPIPQGVALGASGLPHRGRDGHQCAGQLVERVAETVPHACRRAQGPHPPRRAVKALGQAAAAAIPRLWLERGLWKRAVRLGQRRCPGGFGVAQVPEDTPTDHRGPRALGRETAAVLLSRQAIRRQGQPTPRQDRHQTVVAEGTHPTGERQGRAMMAHRAPRQTEAAMGGSQGSARDLGAPLARAPNAGRQDRAHRVTGGARDAPEGEAPEAHPRIRGVAGQAPAAATGGLVGERKAAREEEGKDELEKRWGMAQERKGGRLIVEVDGHGAVRTGRCGGLSPGLPSVEMAVGVEEPS